MSDYAMSVIAKGQTDAKKQWQDSEQRRKMPTVTEMAVKNGDVQLDAVALRTSPLRTVEIYYQNKVAQGSTTAKAYNHTGNYGDSSKTSLVYVTHVETMGIPRKIAANNKLSYEKMFANLYMEKWRNLLNRHDNSALAYALANRVQLSKAVMDPQLASANPGTWNEAQYALEIASADKNLFVDKIKSAMASRYLTGDYDVIADLQMTSLFNKLYNQSTNNAENMNWQFDSVNFYRTQDVIDSDYPLGSVLVMPKGLLSGAFWNEQLNVVGSQEDKGGTVGTFGTMSDPFGIGVKADLSAYTRRADTSANTYGGSPQDIIDEWELTLTIAYALPPLSTANDSVLMEAALAS